MALNCGIIGLTNIGKTSLFNCISNTKAESSNYAFSTSKSNIGMINVPDPRIDELDALVNAAKLVPTTVELVDVPGLTKGSSQGEGIGNKFLGDIRSTDAIIHVLRCFDDENLPHIERSINPVRDKEIVDLELQIKDLEVIEKKIQRLEKLSKTGDKNAKQELEVMQVYSKHLNDFQPARTASVDEKDKKFIKDIALFSAKPVMYVCNVDDESTVTGNKYTEAFVKSVKDENAEVLIIAAGAESEIAELENEDDRKEFLEDMGLSEPGVNKLIRSAYSLLNLITFFTAGPKEIHAWTLRKGLNAQAAAGVIHSDLERGFIRAEVIKYEDYINYGSENAVKEAGKLHVEGKNYIVQDGDVLFIRFNI